MQPFKPALARAHGALMPDYSLAATALWVLLLALGIAALASSVVGLGQRPTPLVMQAIAGVAVAMLAGMFPVLIPRTSFAIGGAEIFIFLMLALIGPEAAVLAAAAEATVASWSLSKRWTSRLASPAISALAMFACGALYEAGLSQAHAAAPASAGAGIVVVALIGCALLYYALTSLLLSAIVRLKRGQALQPFAVLAELRWVAVTYAGSASIAALLYLTARELGPAVLVAAVPVIAMFLLTLHHFFDRQRAIERTHEARVEAAERDAASALRHNEALSLSEQRLQRVFDNAPSGMALLTHDGRIVQTNRALQALLGLDAADSLGQPFAALTADAAPFSDCMAQLACAEVETFAVELTCRHPQGGEVQLAAHASRLSQPGGAVQHVILQVQDITARRAAELRLNHLAFHDSLTGLPNRSQFLQRLHQAVEHHARDAGRGYAVLYFDLDRFKLLNDSQGHAAGDELLVQASRRLRANLRPHDTLARLGGDEFAVLSENVEGMTEMVRLAKRLQAQLQRPFHIGGREIASSASIGITHSDSGTRSADEVLRDADIAMYRAKADGKARHALFHPDQHAAVSERLHLETDLLAALVAGQVDIAFQPLYELAGRRLIGFEALARWQHPQRGAVNPALFIPVAEEAGLLPRITDLVLARACRALRQWQLLGPAFSDLRVHVNIGASDVDDPAFSRRVHNAIDAAGLRAEHLSLELTENILMERLAPALPALQALRQFGLGLSIDDFGVGHSSLSHLCALPINGLKIDASFVRNMKSGGHEAETIRAIVTLGRALGKTVIAEGIETESQYDMLLELGCPFGQGFLMSPPLDAAAVRALLIASAPGRGARRAPVAAGQPAVPLSAMPALAGPRSAEPHATGR